MSIKRFRKKPIEIEAVQWTGQNVSELVDFAGDNIKFVYSFPFTAGIPEILTPEGRMMVSKNDWVIKGTQNEFYPMKDSIFRETYEKVADDE